MLRIDKSNCFRCSDEELVIFWFDDKMVKIWAIFDSEMDADGKLSQNITAVE